MKRLVGLILASCVLLCSCGTGTLGGRISRPNHGTVMDELVEHINNNDADSIVNMFSEETKENCDTLQEDAQALIDLFDHNIVSYDSGSGSESASTRPHKKKLHWYYTIETENDTYNMQWSYTEENDAHPEKIGFNRISVVSTSFDLAESWGIDLDGILVINEDNYYDLRYKEAEVHGTEYYPGKEDEEPVLVDRYLLSWGPTYYVNWEETEDTENFLAGVHDEWNMKLDVKNNGSNCVSGKLPFEFHGTCEEMDVEFGDLVIDEEGKLYLYYDEGHGVYTKVGSIDKTTIDSKGKENGIDQLKTSDQMTICISVTLEEVEE